MSQEYHNKVTIIGAAEKRLDVVRYVLVVTPANWEWVGITVNEETRNGRDSGKSLLDFWSRNFPDGLGELSTRFPGIRFECSLLDITAETEHLLTLVDGMEIASSTEPVAWDEDDVDEAAEERAADEREAKVIMEMKNAAENVVGEVGP